MKLPIAYYGSPVLRKKTLPVLNIDDEIHQLVRDMVETMEANNGCGLAAPQVNRSLSIFITCIPRYADNRTASPGTLRIFINPKIIEVSSETWACEEACISIPGMCEAVIRPVRAVFEATNLEGATFQEEFVGYDARVMMHENDHINGVLYIDRLPPKRKNELDRFLRQIKKKYNP